MKTKYFSIFFIFFVIHQFCLQAKPKNKEIWMNILVHGTVGFQATFTLSNFFLLLKDTITGSPYEQNIRTIRQNPILSTIQPIQQLGLCPINPTANTIFAPALFAELYDKVDQMTFPQNDKANLFYTFGWSGVLSYSQRFFEARLFYIALRAELKKLEKKNIFPKIRIIGYSHGGSIALNLAALRAYEFIHDTFTIDELILLGMPVQSSTMRLVWSSMFDKIYHIYSAGDRVQRADIFNPARMLSYKRFCGELPHNFTQIELKLTARPLTTCETQARSRRFLRTMCQSPGHIELWFFGWTSQNYRKRFTFYPLPAGIFIPYLTKISNYYLPNSRHLTINIYPDTAVSIINHRDERNTFSVPFFNPFTIESFKKLAFCSMQRNYFS